MEFSNPNQFKKMRLLEGFKHPEDIWDIETFDDIKKRIEQFSPNITELISEKELNVEMKRRLEKIRTFCNELSQDFKQTFLSLLKQYRHERREIYQKIVDYFIEKNFVLPNFIITNGKQARALLEEYGVDGNMNEQNLLLVFQLPKPLAQFWWKGGADSWGDMSVDIKDQTIEWGHFYRELMPVVWETQGRHENEKGLNFQRKNNIGQHNPNK